MNHRVEAPRIDNNDYMRQMVDKML